MWNPQRDDSLRLQAIYDLKVDKYVDFVTDVFSREGITVAVSVFLLTSIWWGHKQRFQRPNRHPRIDPQHAVLPTHVSGTSR